jgi:hypothetical protein
LRGLCQAYGCAMAREAGDDAKQAYLIEHYRPGRDVAQLTTSVARLRETVMEMERAGEPVRYLSSTIVPGDESFLCVIEAASERVVVEAYARADLPFERISAAIAVEVEITPKESHS